MSRLLSPLLSLLWDTKTPAFTGYSSRELVLSGSLLAIYSGRCLQVQLSPLGDSAWFSKSTFSERVLYLPRSNQDINVSYPVCFSTSHFHISERTADVPGWGRKWSRIARPDILVVSARYDPDTRYLYSVSDMQWDREIFGGQRQKEDRKKLDWRAGGDGSS